MNTAPGGVAGFDITVTVDDPSVARIVGVTFAPGFDLTNEELIRLEIGATNGTSPSPAIHQVHLFAVDILESVTSGMTNVPFAVIELKAEPLPVGVFSQGTAITISNGLLGTQDDNEGTPVNTVMMPGTLTVD